MKKILCAVMLASTLALGGCASGPSQEQAAITMPALKKTDGRIYFFRESGLGFAVQPDIRLNEQVVGTSQPGGFFYVDRPAGDFTVATKTEVENTVSFHLNKGESKYIRTSVSMGLIVAHISPSVESPEQGREAIRSLKYTGH